MHVQRNRRRQLAKEVEAVDHERCNPEKRKDASRWDAFAGVSNDSESCTDLRQPQRTVHIAAQADDGWANSEPVSSAAKLIDVKAIEEFAQIP